jgi:hypothetical protein
MREVQAHGVRVVLDLLGNPLVKRVKRRIPIRIVRFCRSTNDVFAVLLLPVSGGLK